MQVSADFADESRVVSRMPSSRSVVGYGVSRGPRAPGRLTSGLCTVGDENSSSRTVSRETAPQHVFQGKVAETMLGLDRIGPRELHSIGRGVQTMSDSDLEAIRADSGECSVAAPTIRHRDMHGRRANRRILEEGSKVRYNPRGPTGASGCQRRQLIGSELNTYWSVWLSIGITSVSPSW